MGAKCGRVGRVGPKCGGGRVLTEDPRTTTGRCSAEGGGAVDVDLLEREAETATPPRAATTFVENEGRTLE